MSILCSIGLHRWRVVGYNGLVMPSQVQQCTRCRIGRAICFDCIEWYTAEQMDKAIDQAIAGRRGD